jgi:hypothetical protein
MRYETVHNLSKEDFKRSTEVQRSTFDTMRQAIEQELGNFGRPPKLSRADQILLTLMYWREYRTEFQIVLAYCISESTVYRTIKKIENTLTKSDRFHFPSKKVLQSGSMSLETIVNLNFKHINNPFMRDKIRLDVENAGYKCPVICSPEELLGDGDE